MIRVHNISDRPNTVSDPRAIRIGPDIVRPGQSMLVEPVLINTKLEKLHGTYLWFGPLPPRLLRTSRSALKARVRTEYVNNPPMSVDEARTYLETLSEDQLRELCELVVPPLRFPNKPSKRVLVARLGRTIFMPNRLLDPESFFWLRRWTKRGDIYLERE